MHFSSIRARVVYLGAVFSIVLVGSVTTATYFFVADGMARAAQDAAWRLTEVTQRSISGLLDEVETSVAAEGLPLEGRSLEATQRAVDTMPLLFEFGVVDESSYALRVADRATGDLELLWRSDAEPLDGLDEGRREALRTGRPYQSGPQQRDLLTGMFTKADLGTYVIHMPIELPDGAAAVVDVVYRPLREQAILDSARAPMALVAFFATIVAVLMMQTIMGWVLSLVNRIRRTAESITAGRLDVHLPEEGEHEITELARSLNRLIDVLRTRSEAQTRFVADASHELATPVAGIRGYVNILRAWGGEDPGLREEALAAIDRESRRMARLCTDLLSVIRADEALEHRMKAYDVNAVARHVLAAAATRYIDKQIDFEGPEEGVREAWGDPDRIEEALGTLVDNACKYTPVGGAVRLTTMSTSMNAIVEVADTGVGIPEEDVASIFDRFYRSDASRSKETGGFGLGLAIAKHIIETNGGTISVRSIVGSGTTFTITLPKPGIGGGQ